MTFPLRGKREAPLDIIPCRWQGIPQFQVAAKGGRMRGGTCPDLKASLQTHKSPPPPPDGLPIKPPVLPNPHPTRLCRATIPHWGKVMGAPTRPSAPPAPAPAVPSAPSKSNPARSATSTARRAISPAVRRISPPEGQYHPPQADITARRAPPANGGYHCRTVAAGYSTTLSPRITRSRKACRSRWDRLRGSSRWRAAPGPPMPLSWGRALPDITAPESFRVVSRTA